jgi:hypothetical protein
MKNKTHIRKGKRESKKKKKKKKKIFKHGRQRYKEICDLINQ